VSFRMLATDVDGTLTPDRRSVAVCLEVIWELRRSEERGVKVVLVSSNALPVLVGLARYMGLSGLAIGETGALVYLGGGKVVHLTNYSAREALNDVLEKYGDLVESSWQNYFRLHDYALKIKESYLDKALEVYSLVKEYVEEKYSYLRVGYSGYAIHLTPRDVDKGKALKYLASRLGIDVSEIACVGDSAMDEDFISVCGLGTAVSNADEELKKKAHVVLTKPSCYGVIELIKRVFG